MASFEPDRTRGSPPYDGDEEMGNANTSWGISNYPEVIFTPGGVVGVPFPISVFTPQRLLLPPVSFPLPRKARVRKRGAPRPSQTRRCQPTLVHPRMRGVSTWGMQTPALYLFNAPGNFARAYVLSLGKFVFWPGSKLGIYSSRGWPNLTD